MKMSQVLYDRLVRFHARMLSLKIWCLWRITRERFIVYLWVKSASAAIAYSTRSSMELNMLLIGWAGS